MEKHEKLFQDFSQALRKFEDVLAQEKNEFIRDSALLRFAFTIELAWKTIKACLEWEEKVICRSPRACIKEAYKLGWINYEQKWVNALDLRNQISHLYKEKMAEDIYQQLSSILEVFQKLEKSFDRKIKNH